jgi:hypothetical protein
MRNTPADACAVADRRSLISPLSMTKRPLLAARSVLAVAAIAALGCTSKPDPRAVDPAQPDKSLQCFDQLERNPNYRDAGLPPDTGWVVLEYSLSGNGRASNVTIVGGKHVDDFGRGLVRALERAEFKQGFVSARCRDVVSFEKTLK